MSFGSLSAMNWNVGLLNSLSAVKGCALGRFWPIIIAILTSFAPALAPAAEPRPRTVLVLDATEPNSPWGSEFRTVLRSALNVDATAPVAFYSEVLDLARFNTSEYEELLYTFLRSKYRDKPIGIIVAHGPQALTILMKLRGDLWSTVPVVFASIDKETINRLNLPPDITGTTLQFRLGNMVTAARALVPNLRQLALVGDPYERQPFRRHFAQERSQLAKELQITDLMGLPMRELTARVAVLPANAAILFVPLYVDREGTTYISRDALGQVSKSANRPVISDVATHIGYGSAGGLMSVPEPVAQATARLAARILNGERASDIPIVEGAFARPIFDWQQLQRFGISANSLPPGSEVRFRPQTLWELYRWQLTGVFAVVLFQAAMITWLLLERQRRYRAEVEARGRLQEVMHLNRTATAGVLSASFSHELNQPLGAILSNAEAAELLLAANPPDVGQVMEILADIRRDDQRAGEIIKHLGGLLRKKSRTELQEFDLNDAIRTALNLLDPEASNRGIVLDVSQMQTALPVRADPVHLQQVILNLALNAMDAMLNCVPGSRKVTLGATLIGHTEVEVSVADTGTGIPEDKLKHVFDTFFTTKPHGTGLGLSIARTIIENYGGSIWAENKVDGGAVFRFVLPLAKIQAA